VARTLGSRSRPGRSGNRATGRQGPGSGNWRQRNGGAALCWGPLGRIATPAPAQRARRGLLCACGLMGCELLHVSERASMALPKGSVVPVACVAQSHETKHAADRRRSIPAPTSPTGLWYAEPRGVRNPRNRADRNAVSDSRLNTVSYDAGHFGHPDNRSIREPSLTE
jgi:hypothetical protein